jgi:hypothetical protein
MQRSARAWREALDRHPVKMRDLIRHVANNTSPGEKDVCNSELHI